MWANFNSPSYEQNDNPNPNGINSYWEANDNQYIQQNDERLKKALSTSDLSKKQLNEIRWEISQHTLIPVRVPWLYMRSVQMWNWKLNLETLKNHIVNIPGVEEEFMKLTGLNMADAKVWALKQFVQDWVDRVNINLYGVAIDSKREWPNDDGSRGMQFQFIFES